MVNPSFFSGSVCMREFEAPGSGRAYLKHKLLRTDLVIGPPFFSSRRWGTASGAWRRAGDARGARREKHRRAVDYGARLLRGLFCSRKVTGNTLCVVKLYDVFVPVESYPPWSWIPGWEFAADVSNLSSSGWASCWTG